MLVSNTLFHFLRMIAKDGIPVEEFLFKIHAYVKKLCFSSSFSEKAVTIVDYVFVAHVNFYEG